MPKLNTAGHPCDARGNSYLRVVLGSRGLGVFCPSGNSVGSGLNAICTLTNFDNRRLRTPLESDPAISVNVSLASQGGSSEWALQRGNWIGVQNGGSMADEAIVFITGKI